MATKTAKVYPSDVAGEDFRECAGQPLVEVRAPYLEADENNVKPDQRIKYKVNGFTYYIERGRRTKIPKDHYMILMNAIKDL